jgi:DNA repair protein RadC
MLMKDDVKERLYQYGPKVLTNAELIALILRKGKKNVSPLCVAESIAAEDEACRQLASCHSADDLLYRYSVTQEQAMALLAAMELGKRQVLASTTEADHITSPGAAAQYLMGRLRYETHECFVVLLLNTKNRVIRGQRIAEGSLSSAVVHPREVYAPAVTAHAASILVAHNHPSGDPYPSAEDRNLTLALTKAGDVLGIPLMDHIIIGDGRYYSFKEHGAV